MTRLRFPFRCLPGYFWRPRFVKDAAQPKDGAVDTVQVALSIHRGKIGSSFLGRFEYRFGVGKRNKSDQLRRNVGQRGDLLLKFSDSAREPATTVFHVADLLTFRRKILCELSGSARGTRV